MPRPYLECSSRPNPVPPVALLVVALAAGMWTPPASDTARWDRFAGVVTLQGPAGSDPRPAHPAALGAAPTSPSLTVSINASTNGTDAGRSFAVTATPTGGTPPYVLAWSDSEGDIGDGPSWTITPPAPSDLTVSVVATDANGSVAFAYRGFRVADPPVATIDPTPISAGADGGALLLGSVTGGTAPYSAHLTVAQSGYNATFAIRSPGPFSAPSYVGNRTEVSASILVTDAVNATSSDDRTLSVIALPPLVLEVGPSPIRVDAGQTVRLLILIAGAVAPASYAIASAAPIANASAASGSVGTNGTVAWSGAFPEPGIDSLYVTARDGAGRSAETTVSVLVAAPLSVFLTTAAALVPPDGRIACTLTLSGGTPPYSWLLVGPDGEAATSNASAPGSFNTSLPATSPGALTLVLEVWDAFDDHARGMANLSVPAAGSASPGPAPPGVGSAEPFGAIEIPVAAASGAVLASLFWWRRSRRAPVRARDGTSASAALHEVRRLLTEGAGLDRETLGLLAEEHGFARAEAEGALDRWVRAGQAEVERGEDGTERFRWVSPRTDDNPLEEVP